MPENQPQDWRASLPAELREAPALKDTKDVAGLAKQFIDVQEHLGNSIRIPSKDAGKPDIEAFHSKLVERVPGLYYYPSDEDAAAKDALFAKLGTPKEAKEYEIPVPKDGQEIPGFRDTAFKSKLTKSQVKEIATWFSSVQEGAAQQQTQAHTAEVGKLDAEWGAAKTNKVNAIVALATKTGAPPPLIEAIQKGTIAPSMLRWFDGMVKAIGTEGNQLTGNKNDGPSSLTPKEAETQVDEIMRRPEYREKSPLGESLRAKVQDLAKVAWPG